MCVLVAVVCVCVSGGSVCVFRISRRVVSCVFRV